MPRFTLQRPWCFCACITVGSSCWCFRNPARKPTWEVHKNPSLNNGEKLPLPQQSQQPSSWFDRGRFLEVFSLLVLDGVPYFRSGGEVSKHQVSKRCTEWLFLVNRRKKERKATAMNFVFFWQIWEDHELPLDIQTPPEEIFGPPKPT